MITRAENLKMMIQSYLGVEYLWGGDDAQGIDCSGLVQELLWSVNGLPYRQPVDKTAHGIYSLAKQHGVLCEDCPDGLDGNGLGIVAFWTKDPDGHITHCELVTCKRPDVLSVGARGGKHIEGFVKIRPTMGRNSMIFKAFGNFWAT